MGKWTLDYHDDVLRNKLKNMVSAAIKRTKLEKGEPSITYEAFVEELDEGDAFTSTMIDVLVKEMAERRTRPNPIDRRLFISERTAKSLSLQASSRVYQNRSRRRYNFLDYVPSPPSETEPSEPEEDFGQLRGESAPEGVRINTDLYDAYSSMRFAADESLTQAEREGDVRRLLAEIPTVEEIDARPTVEQLERAQSATSPRSSSPPLSGFRNSFWDHPASGSSSLHRSGTLRRSNRARNDNFSDFTLRRRLATRQNSTHDTERSRQDETADGTWDFGSSRFSRTEDETASSSSAPLPHANARRFFPLSAWTSARRRIPPSDIWGPEPRASSPLASSSTTPTASQLISAGSSTATAQSSAQLWYSLTSGRTSPGVSSTTEMRRHSIGGDITSDGRSLAPRLRRGGLRAPESLLSRYASPNMDPSAASSSTNRGGPSATQETDIGVGGTTERLTETSLSLTTGGGGSISWDGVEEHQLLTPRSVSPPDER